MEECKAIENTQREQETLKWIGNIQREQRTVRWIRNSQRKQRTIRWIGNNQKEQERPGHSRQGETGRETRYLTPGEGPVNQILLFTFSQPNKCPGRPSARLGQGTEGQDHITEVNVEMCWGRSENSPEEGGLSTKPSAGRDRANGQGHNEQ